MRLQSDELDRFAAFLRETFSAEVTLIAPRPNADGECLLANLWVGLLTVSEIPGDGAFQVWCTDEVILSVVSVVWLGVRKKQSAAAEFRTEAETKESKGHNASAHSCSPSASLLSARASFQPRSTSEM